MTLNEFDNRPSVLSNREASSQPKITPLIKKLIVTQGEKVNKVLSQTTFEYIPAIWLHQMHSQC